MSSLNFDGPRRFSRPTSARTFPETYYNERHVSYDYPRADPYPYAMGGPVSGLRNRAHAERDEFQPEQGGARRRIAVAVSQIAPAYLLIGLGSWSSWFAVPQLRSMSCVAKTDIESSARVVERGRSVALETKVIIKAVKIAKQQALRPVNASSTA